MDIHGIIAQIIGFSALLCFIVSYQVRTNKGLFACQLAGNSLFFVQFILLGALSGGINNGIGVIRNIMLLQNRKYAWCRWNGWVLIYLSAFGAATWLTWDGWPSLLTFAAMAAGTISYWTDNARYIRIGVLFCASPCWLIYDMIYHSYGGIINESLSIASILVSIYRFGWKNLGSKESGF